MRDWEKKDENGKTVTDLSEIEAGDTFAALNMPKTQYLHLLREHQRRLQEGGVSVEVAREFGAAGITISDKFAAEVIRRILDLEAKIKEVLL